MDKISRSALVDAALDLNRALELEPGVDVKLGAAALRCGVVEAAMWIIANDFGKLAPATLGVVDRLREEIIAMVPQAREDLIATMTEAGVPEDEIQRQAGDSAEEKIAEVTAVLDALRDRLGTNAQADEAETVEAEPEPEVKRGVVMAAAKPKAARAKAKSKVTARPKTAKAKPKIAKPKVAKAKATKPKVADKPKATKPKVADKPKVVVKKTRAAVPRVRQQPANGAASRSRYVIDPELVAAGQLPKAAPVVTSPANAKQYQPKFDSLLKLARAGDWDGVRQFPTTGSNPYSKYVARYREDLLATHAAAEN